MTGPRRPRSALRGVRRPDPPPPPLVAPAPDDGPPVRSPKLAVCCFKWHDRKFRGDPFTAEQVNIWAKMVSRHLTLDYKLYCITDDPKGIDSSVTTVPLWKPPEVISASWNNGRPQCYRRAKLFDPEINDMLDGTHVVNMDLDLTIVGNIDHLFAGFPSFRIMGGGSPRNPYNGSMWMFRKGTHHQVWSLFTPVLAAEASSRFMGSDQAWFRFALGPDKPTWGKREGVWQFIQLRRATMAKTTVPKGVCLVFFAGAKKPWQSAVQAHFPWIREAWGPTEHYLRIHGPINKIVGNGGKSQKIKNLSVYLPKVKGATYIMS